jgi:hypothetical protein
MRVAGHERQSGDDSWKASTSQPAIQENAFPEVAGEASLALGVLVSNFGFRRKRWQPATLQDRVGLFWLAGVFEGYFVHAAEV